MDMRFFPMIENSQLKKQVVEKAHLGGEDLISVAYALRVKWHMASHTMMPIFFR
jgi:hypothetical protein